MKKIILPGSICIVDPKNKMAQKENFGPVLVSVICKLSWAPFGKSVWKCADTCNGIIYTVYEKYLFPIKEIDHELLDSIIIRNPINAPEITKEDIDTLRYVINDPSLNDKPIINQLSKLYIKLRFYASMENKGHE